jgi:Ca-activated chloride channel family protein
MIPKDMHFNFIDGMYFLIFALIIPLIGYGLFLYRKKILQKFGTPEVLEEIVIPRSNTNYWSKVIALTLVVVLSILAWMEPVGNGHYPTGVKVPLKEDLAKVRRRVSDVIFLIDASASMGVKDSRTGSTRLEYAKEIVEEVISRLQGENVALWAFTSEPSKLSPLTMDYLFVRLRLRQMDINEGDVAGTNFVEALAALRQEYFSVISPRHRTLIILSDGGDTHLESMPISEQEKETISIANLVGQADVLNLKVYTLGIGSQNGKAVPNVSYEGKPVISKLDDKLLKELANRGRGDYYPANDLTTLNVAENLISKIQKQGGIEELNIRTPVLGNKDLVYDLYFQIPLAGAILLLIFSIFFPDTRRKKEQE